MSADDDSFYLNFGRAIYHLDAVTGVERAVYRDVQAPPPMSLAEPRTFQLSSGNQNGEISLRTEGDRLIVEMTTDDPDLTLDDAWELFFDFRPASRRHLLYDRGVFYGRLLVKDGSWNPPQLPGSSLPQPKIVTEVHKNGTRNSVRLSLDLGEAAKVAAGGTSEFAFAAVLLSADGDRPMRKFGPTKLKPPTAGYLNCTDLVYVLPEDWQVFSTVNASTPPATEGGAKLEPLAKAPERAKKWGLLPEPNNVTPVQRETASKFGFSREGGNVVWRRLSSPNNSALGIKAIRPNLGVTRVRLHPITGEEVPREWARQFSAEGGASEAWTMDFVPHSDPAYYDYADDSGLRTFAVSTHPNHANLSGYMPALGTWYIQPQGNGCNCQNNVQTSLVMGTAEKRSNEDWGTFWTDGKEGVPVRSMYLNFSASGDRRDAAGKLWLGFPRMQRLAEGYSKALPGGMPVFLGVPFHPEFGAEGARYAVNADRVPFAGTSEPWIYSGGLRDLRRAAIDLLFYQPRTTFISVPVPQAPKVDGKLDDSCWDGVGRHLLGENVYTFRGSPFGAVKAPEGMVYLRHDADGIYVGSEINWPFPLIPEAGNEQAFWQSAKRFVIGFLDQSTDKWALFGVSPESGRFDATKAPEDGKEQNISWQGNWTAAVGASSSGGSCIEFAIPWKTIEEAGLLREGLRMLVLDNAEPLKNSSKVGYRPGLCVVTQRPKLTRYTVRLHFAEPDEVRPGDRIFDIKLNGKVVHAGLDIVSETGGRRRALTKEFKGVETDRVIELELVPKAGQTVISGLEVEEEH